MTFTWRLLDAGGTQVGSSESFRDRDEAESWLGEAWEGLARRGVAAVDLVDEDSGERLYRMGLGPG